MTSSEDLACLTVMAGHITYGGEIVPEVQDRNAMSNIVYTNQHYAMRNFLEMLQAQFPKIAAAYPLATPTAPPAGVKPPSLDDAVTLWDRHNPDNTQTIFAQNNAAWPATLEHLELYDCVNVEQACDKQALDLKLAPFETRELMTVGPADPARDFEYRYRWDFKDR